MRKLLIIEDDEAVLDTLKLYIEMMHKGYRVDVTRNVKVALAKIPVENYDIILIDHVVCINSNHILPHLELLKKVKTPIILTSSYPDCSFILKQLETSLVLKKPFDVDELDNILNNL